MDQKIENLTAYSIEQLIETINSDEAPAVKHAAIHRLPFDGQLLVMATSSPRSPHEAHARKRIGELLDEKKLTIEELSKKIPDQALLLTLCGYSSNAGIALVMQIDDEALLLELSKTSGTTAMRQAAAEKIHSHKYLLDLQKAAKNKDKSVYTIVKTKLDEHKQIQIQQNKINDEGAALCVQVEQLTKRDIDEYYTTRKLQISDSWQALANAVSKEVQERFTLAMALCQTKIDDHQAEIQKQKDLQEAERSAKKQLLAPIKDLQLFIADVFSSDTLPDVTAQLESLKKTYASALQSAKDNGLNTHKEERYFNELMDHAYQLTNKLKENGSLATLLVALAEAPAEAGEAIKRTTLSILAHAKALRDVPAPEVVASSKEVVDKWNQEMRGRAQAAKARIDESFGLIRRGLVAVSDGQVRRARAIFNDLEKRMEGMDALPTKLEIKYDEFKAAIHTLGDWHEFAVTPKKEALIESMNGLVQSTLQPKDLADRIKSLQEQWKELSKGGQQDDSTLWEQFQTAAKTAYEPCKIYFAQQSNEREENTKKRQQLNEQLQEYLDGYDWDNANWKDVGKTLRASREAWQSFWPVARKDNKNLQATFDKIADAIYQKIADEFERNRLKKQAIVDGAKQLLENADISEAIESAKKLQGEWQAVGRAKPKVDQELWKEFRAHCDAVFEKRKQESEAEQQARDAEKIAADEILSKLDNILTLNGPDFFAAKSEADELTDAFKSLGEFPKNHYQTLNQKFHQFADKFQKKIVFERKHAQLSAWVDIFSASQKASMLEILTAKNEATDNLMQTLSETISNAQKWPNAVLSNLQSRLDASDSYSLESQAENLRKLRLLCVRSEISNDIETPAEDKSIRMEFQVEQLQRGLGSHTAQKDNSLETLVSSWVAVQATAEADYQKLEDRFRSALGLKKAEKALEVEEAID